jgi:hypothetical protein
VRCGKVVMVVEVEEEKENSLVMLLCKVVSG